MFRYHLAALFGVLVLLAVLGTGTATAQQAIIVDHRCTDLSVIPAQWIERAKLLRLHFAHTSHGSQIESGLEVLEAQDPTYSFAVRISETEGLPPVEDPPALRIYDGNPPETYITPEDYWATDEGQSRTRAVAATGHYDFSMWSFCGEQSWYAAEQTQNYLWAMALFENEFLDMRFILMTGHTDGSGVTGNLNQRNEQIRAYARESRMILLDFADIESWDPDGVWYLPLGCNDNGDYSGGNWCQQWCAAHPGDPLCASCSCAHSQPIICNLKARAFWWMMARLAGWDGPQILGDLNCDDAVNFDDINPFVLALADPDGYAIAYPDCTVRRGDCNGDGRTDFQDINAFVELLAGK